MLAIRFTKLQFLTSAAPWFTVTFAYLHITYKGFHRAKSKVDAVNAERMNPNRQTLQQGSSLQNAGSPHVHNLWVAVPGTTPKSPTKTNYAFLVLSLLTLSSVLCWTPRTIMYFVGQPDFFGVPFKFASFLFLIQAVLDPFLLAVAIKDLRVALHRALVKPFSQ